MRVQIAKGREKQRESSVSKGDIDGGGESEVGGRGAGLYSALRYLCVVMKVQTRENSSTMITRRSRAFMRLAAS